MYLVGLVLITSAFVNKNYNRSTKYGLIIFGWAVVALHYVILERNWVFACAAVALGVLYVAIVAHVEKEQIISPQTKIKK